MAPGYYPDTYQTGAAEMLQQHHKEMLEMDRYRRMELMRMHLQDISYNIEHFGPRQPARFSQPVSRMNDTSEPGFERREVPRWLERLIDDPIWEIFKRPRIKV